MLPANVQVPAGVFLILVGLVACFAGYRLFRAVLTVYGFLLGAFFAVMLLSPAEPMTRLLTLGVGGLLGALALWAGYYAGVAIIGGTFGVILAHSAWFQWRGADPGLLVVLLFAAVGVAVALTMHRIVLILLTAFLGAQTAVAGVLALLSRAAKVSVTGFGLAANVHGAWTGRLTDLGLNRRWPLVAWVVLGVVGAFVQLRSGAKRKKAQ
jgi:hypothetical protein